MLRRLKKIAFSMSPEEASFERRGFECVDAEVKSNLEEVLRVFISGYNLTLQIEDYQMLADRLERGFDRHHVGFAFEGAGMCCALLDLLAPKKVSRLRAFTDSAAARHDYIVTVGAGFAVARIPYGLRVLNRYFEKLDPMVAWCILDGYGFHQGMFHMRTFIEERKEPPAGLEDYGRQLFDAGLGRSLWWSRCGHPGRIKQTIDRFPEVRRGEMWHGIGVACSYACGTGTDALLELLEVSGRYWADFLSGIPFASRMRQKGGNSSSSTDLACRLLLKTSADQAANMVARSLDDVTAEWTGTKKELGKKGYMLVRQRVTSEFQHKENKARFAFN